MRLRAHQREFALSEWTCVPEAPAPPTRRHEMARLSCQRRTRGGHPEDSGRIAGVELQIETFLPADLLHEPARDEFVKGAGHAAAHTPALWRFHPSERPGLLRTSVAHLRRGRVLAADHDGGQSTVYRHRPRRLGRRHRHCSAIHESPQDPKRRVPQAGRLPDLQRTPAGMEERRDAGDSHQPHGTDRRRSESGMTSNSRCGKRE